MGCVRSQVIYALSQPHLNITRCRFQAWYFRFKK